MVALELSYPMQNSEVLNYIKQLQIQCNESLLMNFTFI